MGQLARAIDGASSVAAEPQQHPVAQQVLLMLRSTSATAGLLAACVATSWAQLRQQQQQLASPAAPPAALQQLQGALLELLTMPAPAAAQYSELAPLVTQLRGQASALIGRALQAGVALAMPCPLDQLGHAAALGLEAQVPPGGEAGQALAAAQLALQSTAGALSASEAMLHTHVCAARAAAVVHLSSVGPPLQLPAKLNTIIQPLVAAVRREPVAALQDVAAAALAALALLAADRTPSPNDK